MVRFGVIGTNWITERLLEAANDVEDFKLTAVYSRTISRAEEFASKYGVTKIFTNLKEMAVSQEIDAVYIATPNSYHAEQAILFLQNGKHVLCEKPLAVNATEVARMIQAAKDHNALLMEAMKSTLLPNFKVIQDNLHKIGPIRRYFASYCQYSSRYDKYKEGIVLNAFNPEFANGSLMDLGVYCLYPLITLFGEPKEVKATGIMLDSGVDGEGSVILKYDDKDAIVMYSKITNSYLPSEIQGEKGSIMIDKIHTAEKVEIHYTDGTVEQLTVDQSHPAMYYEVKEFIELINRGKTESDTNSYKNSYTTIQVLDKVRDEIGLVYQSDHK
ncbi:Gfo/Idh/MocA family oxidoreductase [Bacillaceae bacterium CLA-AA-H227]|jgi:predicted dehydrogenase|uniref:Gfo/Idh/MocA family protein n=2 Tax=Bacillales TaxID=1385 RepID=A0ABW3QHC2_9BACL|nr:MULTISPECIES: Gfo/Idh/MocA family oxidoreductase [Bacillales]MBY0155396.1 Gfo/Idh/MocA family oxidoreductase [Cytobacillus firmus]PMC34633.1 gfo/Idh/MocA family oxidoreductase [Bacillus sp. UMB0899]SGI66312.1 oxidoreductase YulF [Mycobacterium tuberculosis]MCM3130642.1 Gfo/Idh/MocA family oxidoreductase [Paenibacillus sp. MER 78]MCM3443343.1 Gfo/Idh/MocA family oxidoreductase [Metabacillus halosaccharovorans]